MTAELCWSCFKIKRKCTSDRTDARTGRAPRTHSVCGRRGSCSLLCSLNACPRNRQKSSSHVLQADVIVYQDSKKDRPRNRKIEGTKETALRAEGGSGSGRAACGARAARRHRLSVAAAPPLRCIRGCPPSWANKRGSPSQPACASSRSETSSATPRRASRLSSCPGWAPSRAPRGPSARSWPTRTRPERKSRPLVLILDCTSRGRRKQSNAAKMSRNGARTAERQVAASQVPGRLRRQDHEAPQRLGELQ